MKLIDKIRTHLIICGPLQESERLLIEAVEELERIAKLQAEERLNILMADWKLAQQNIQAIGIERDELRQDFNQLKIERDNQKARIYRLERELAEVMDQIKDGTPEEIDLIQEVATLSTRLGQIRTALEKIVVTVGDDKGVVLLSDEGPTDWNEKVKAHVYRHEYFSPLGDALIALYDLTKD